MLRSSGNSVRQESHCELEGHLASRSYYRSKRTPRAPWIWTVVSKGRRPTRATARDNSGAHGRGSDSSRRVRTRKRAGSRDSRLAQVWTYVRSCDRCLEGGAHRDRLYRTARRHPRFLPTPASLFLTFDPARTSQSDPLGVCSSGSSRWPGVVLLRRSKKPR